jgi:phenylacetate-CoA ligase
MPETGVWCPERSALELPAHFGGRVRFLQADARRRRVDLRGACKDLGRWGTTSGDLSMRSFLYKYLVYYPVAAIRAGDVAGRLRYLRSSQFWSREDIRELQGKKLLEVVKHAGEPGEQERRSRDVRGLDDLHLLPFTTKLDIQRRLRELQPLRWVGAVRKTTGGSTGQPVTVVKTRSAWAWELAAAWRGFSWAGVGIGDAQARFWGMPAGQAGRLRAASIDAVCNRRRFSAFDFSWEEMARYERDVARLRPKYFYGYVSMLTMFAEYFRSEGRRPCFGLTCIITTSEVLSQPQRTLLEGVFGTTVFNEYGCGEVGTIGHECEAGGMHVNDENLILEIVDGERICQPGEIGEIVVTDLDNYAMPLIRYRTGDFGTTSRRLCRCGRQLTLLDEVHGRAYDFIVNSKGRRFHGEALMYIFEDLKREGASIRQFQVVQRGPSSFLVRLVSPEDSSERSRDRITEEFRRRIDDSANVEFEYVEEIQREKSGKLRVIVGMV